MQECWLVRGVHNFSRNLPPADTTNRSYDVRKLFFLITLLCNFPSLQATDLSPGTAAIPAQHPLTGNWAWTLPGKPCSETLKYRADGTRTSTSGEEITQSRYEISPMPSLLGFYRLVETITESNNKRDCSGDLHEASGEPVIRFIQFNPKRDQFIVCREEELKACFGPLKRSNE